MKPLSAEKISKRIRVAIWIFIIALCLSGITAFPIVSEVTFLHDKIIPFFPFFCRHWFDKLYNGIINADRIAPFIFYGTDWLAFAHLVIAIAFIGPLMDPVRNIWVIQFGRLASFLIFPLAFVCGPVRGIPFWWQLIDCSFGAGGLIILTIIHGDIQKLESLINNKNL